MFCRFCPLLSSGQSGLKTPVRQEKCNIRDGMGETVKLPVEEPLDARYQEAVKELNSGLVPMCPRTLLF